MHPVAYQYEHRSDPEQSLSPVLTRLEKRLFWQTFEQSPVRERIDRLREAMQCTREVQVLGHTKTGNVEYRMAELANHILQKNEQEWLEKTQTGDVISRVKDLRTAIVADMANGRVDHAERTRRWRILADLYYAQCMSLHVPGYLDQDAAGDRYHHRLFETVERMEEELTDKATLHRDLHVAVRVGEAIEIDPNMRKPRGTDPFMVDLRARMLQLLGVGDHWPPQPVVECAVDQSTLD